MKELKIALANETTKKKFGEMLGKKAPGFVSSIINLVSNNDYLAKCDHNSIIMSAAVAATLDLPINPNLGFAYIVPYKDKAQFQMGYKGFIQLAMRSGQYQTIGASPIFKGQLKSQNPLTSEFDFDFNIEPKGEPVGYAAYFKLINGFEKTVYWPVEKLTGHGQRFSQTFKKGYGLWKDDFESMATKTVIKNLLSKWGILSIEMQNAIKYDQSIINDIENDDFVYIDNEKINKDKIEEKTAELSDTLNFDEKK